MSEICRMGPLGMAEEDTAGRRKAVPHYVTEVVVDESRCTEALGTRAEGLLNHHRTALEGQEGSEEDRLVLPVEDSALQCTMGAVYDLVRQC